MAKVSFDFDDTLNLGYMSMFAKRLCNQGHEVWIVTARQNKNVPNNWNDDLFWVANDIGIPKEQIYFCNLVPKWKFFKESDFIWHIDDDQEERIQINENTDVLCISHFVDINWQQTAIELIK